MNTYPINEEAYSVYTEGDPNIAVHESGMEDRMTPNSQILKRHPEVNSVYLLLAREIWQAMRNPRIVSNDFSHPNNWNEFQLVKVAKIIETEMG